MEDQLISFKTAKLAKEKGFTQFSEETKKATIDPRNEKLLYYDFYIELKDEVKLKKLVGTNSSNFFGVLENYNGVNTPANYYLSPTQSLLHKWLREVFQCDLIVRSGARNMNGDIMDWHGSTITRKGVFRIDHRDGLDKYEDAFEVLLFESLNRIL